MATRGWLIALLLLGLVAPRLGRANVTGVCANCHVMHASLQSTLTPGAGPQSYLMKDTCLGCHTEWGGGSGAPYVYGAATDLAGGDFDNASGANPSSGHNPLGIGAAAVLTPPGWKVSIDFNDNGQVGGDTAGPSWTSQLTCDGVWGCHGQHTSSGIAGAHHNHPTSAAGVEAAATEVGNSYRFLYRIKGYEDADYEAETATNHNVYYGVGRASDTPTDNQTVSYLCAECHGLFHSGAGSEGVADSSFASPWIRHPVDISMSASGEYSGYTYQVAAPVASTTLTEGQHSTSSTSVSGVNNRIVTCLSCHRAHASPYYAGLRWDYRGSGGTWTNGCSYCHSAKN